MSRCIQGTVAMHRVFFILGLAAVLQPVYSRQLNLTAYMKFSNKCQCGKIPEEIQTRIVGGAEAKEHSHPWLVAILSNNRMHCGGSLINDRYILTAGHCLNWNDINDFSIILGMHDRVLMENERKGGVVAVVRNGVIHEDFSSDYLHDSDDLALIRLKEPVTFSDQVQTVCLPLGAYENPDDKKVTVAGWGRTTQGGTPSQTLQEASLKVMPNNVCKNVSLIGEHITDSVICAYGKNVDACQGDSGGPLTWESRNRAEQIGVVSWGIGCAKRGMPGIYARMTKYLEWIVAHTRDGIYCEDPALKQ